MGKTTLTELIARRFEYKAMREPVNENPYLEKFYQNPKEYALEMQFWLMSRRFLMHEEAIRHVMSTGQGVVMDRSIYGDYVFARHLYLDGKISSLGFMNYMAMRNVMERFLYVPRTTIYLRAAPSVCLSRIKARDRGCETSITMDYLSGLDKIYLELINKLRALGSQIESWNWNEFPDEDDLMRKLHCIVQPNYTRYSRLNPEMFLPMIEERL